KAALYTRALVADIVDKRRNFVDPAWLLRVGIYLELLTCLGIVEAVRDEGGDLLTAQERAADEGEGSAAVAERGDPEAVRPVSIRRPGDRSGRFAASPSLGSAFRVPGPSR